MRHQEKTLASFFGCRRRNSVIFLSPDDLIMNSKLGLFTKKTVMECKRSLLLRSPYYSAGTSLTLIQVLEDVSHRSVDCMVRASLSGTIHLGLYRTRHTSNWCLSSLRILHLKSLSFCLKPKLCLPWLLTSMILALLLGMKGLYTWFKWKAAIYL